MTSTSIVYTNLQSRVESLNQIFNFFLNHPSASSPFDFRNEIKHAFEAINTNLGTSFIPRVMPL
jgi:hypothetical protein